MIVNVPSIEQEIGLGEASGSMRAAGLPSRRPCGAPLRVETSPNHVSGRHVRVCLLPHRSFYLACTSYKTCIG